MKKLIRIALHSVCAALCLQSIAAEAVKADVYTVTGASVRVREQAKPTGNVLLTLPRGSFIIHYNDSMQSQHAETVAGKKGRWLRVAGFHGSHMGHIFEGFLDKPYGLKARDIDYGCRATMILKGKRILQFVVSPPAR
jgi:hypothetical protein